MMQRYFVMLALVASPVAAQDPEGPVLDPQILEACLISAEGDLEREACIGIAANRCQVEKEGSSTPAIAACLDQEMQLWDSQLNAAYKELMTRTEQNNDQSEFGSTGTASGDLPTLLKNMQIEWIGYRDAACLYAHAKWGESSIRNMAGASCRLELTAKQALTLQRYLDENQ